MAGGPTPRPRDRTLIHTIQHSGRVPELKHQRGGRPAAASEPPGARADAPPGRIAAEGGATAGGAQRAPCGSAQALRLRSSPTSAGTEVRARAAARRSGRGGVRAPAILGMRDAHLRAIGSRVRSQGKDSASSRSMDPASSEPGGARSRSLPTINLPVL
jgi:hypothetical protein